jgi:hypothetical protein
VSKSPNKYFRKLEQLRYEGYDVTLRSRDEDWQLELHKDGELIVSVESPTVEGAIGTARHSVLSPSKSVEEERPPAKVWNCPSGKFVFATEAAAEHAATQLTRKNLRQTREKDRTAVRAYECDRCGAWHCTSMSATDPRVPQRV